MPQIIPPEFARLAIEKIIGTPDSVTGPEHNYRCPVCAKKGLAHHLHINYLKGMGLCHECRFGSTTLAGLVGKLGGDLSKFRAEDRTESQEWQESVEDALWEIDTTPTASGEIKLPPFFQPFSKVPQTRVERVCAEYMDSRGFTSRVRRKLNAGFCSDGPLRCYAVFPVEVEGKRVTWTSRRCPGGVGGKQKHAFGTGTAKRALFNHDNCLESKRVFITEGPFDAWAMHQRLKPTDGGIALLGTFLHPEQAQVLADLPATTLTIMLDEDAYEKSVLLGMKMAQLTGKRVKVAKLTDKRDPDELPTEELRALSRSAIVVDELTAATMMLESSDET